GILLIGLWTTPRDRYPALFHAHANAVLGWFGPPPARLETPAPDSALHTDTTLISTARRGDEAAWQSWFSVGRIGYWPSAALVAMLLATPLSPLRRILAVLAGLVSIDAFTLARIAVEIAYADSELEAASGGVARGLLHLLLRIGSESLTATIPSAAFVFVCW